MDPVLHEKQGAPALEDRHWFRLSITCQTFSILKVNGTARKTVKNGYRASQSSL
jgi:hypothetical protein